MKATSNLDINPQNTREVGNHTAAFSIACHFGKHDIFVVYHLINMLMKKNWELFIKNFEKFVLRKKKISLKMRRNHEKLIYAYFYIANSTFSCQI